ncbi:MAG: acyl-CoA thioesterase [Bacteroidota bacterium]
MNPVSVADTYTKKTELVLPNDTNNLGNLMGGILLKWMDVNAAISAMRATRRTVVTVSVDFVEFRHSIPQGSVVILESKVTRTFNSSMEVKVDVSYEILQTGEFHHSNSAFYSFVAVDQSGRSIPVNPVIPETHEEKELYESALERREMRLLLSGRMKLEDSQIVKKRLNENRLF